MDNTKNTVKKYLKRYFIDAMGAMALGLFASLLIGTIFKALGMIPHCEFLAQIGGYAQSVAGPAMAVAIAYSLCKDPLVIFSSAAVGYAANLLGAAGGPLAVLFITIAAAECGRLVSKLVGAGSRYLHRPAAALEDMGVKVPHRKGGIEDDDVLMKPAGSLVAINVTLGFIVAAVVLVVLKVQGVL